MYNYKNKRQIRLPLVENIRRIRKMKGFKQEYIAFELEISPHTYSRLECGYIPLTYVRLRKIAEILEVHYLSFFLFDEDKAILNILDDKNRILKDRTLPALNKLR